MSPTMRLTPVWRSFSARSHTCSIIKCGSPEPMSDKERTTPDLSGIACARICVFQVKSGLRRSRPASVVTTLTELAGCINRSARCATTGVLAPAGDTHTETSSRETEVRASASSSANGNCAHPGNDRKSAPKAALNLRTAEFGMICAQKTDALPFRLRFVFCFEALASCRRN